MRPTTYQRKHVRAMLRAGLSRFQCERYLAGSRLIRTLTDLAYAVRPIRTLGDFYEHWGAMVLRSIRKPLPLFKYMSKNYVPTYGHWRSL